MVKLHKRKCSVQLRVLKEGGGGVVLLHLGHVRVVPRCSQAESAAPEETMMTSRAKPAMIRPLTEDRMGSQGRPLKETAGVAVACLPEALPPLTIAALPRLILACRWVPRVCGTADPYCVCFIMSKPQTNPLVNYG